MYFGMQKMVCGFHPFLGNKNGQATTTGSTMEKIWMPMGDVPAMVDDTAMGHSINHH